MFSPMLQVHVSSVSDVSYICFNCIYADIAKVDQVLHMLQLLYTYVASDCSQCFICFFSYVCCKFVYPDVAYVSHICCKCFYLDVAYVCNYFSSVFHVFLHMFHTHVSYFIRMLQLFYLDVSKVDRECCACCNVSHLPPPTCSSCWGAVHGGE
jgi:hypothetical protein